MALLSFRPRFPALRSLAVPSVCLLICFLAYSSQYLFYRLDPGPLTTSESIWFNILVAAVWLSYERACRVDPGRLPRNLAEAGEGEQYNDELGRPENLAGDKQAGKEYPRRSGRWCKKCEAVKPPRAHHCRQCGRCIPKMDHHCPWTSNCVSHTTFPHFLRFVFYTVISLTLLTYYLFARFRAIWHARNLPSYLGPSIGAIIHLLILAFTTTALLFALTILLMTTVKGLLTNTTMIEAWEIERHASLVDRSRYLGGYVQGPGGRRVQIVKQEFPYDIGFWRNIVQGMGSKNALAWFLPFGSAPENKSAWGPWKENGFEDPGVRWPPVDPDKLSGTADWKKEVREEDRYLSTHSVDDGEDQVQAFRRRQEADYRRWESSRRENPKSGLRLRTSEAGPGKHTYEDKTDGVEYEDEDFSGEDLEQDEYEEGIDGNPGWTSSEGNRLRDFGVDEEAEVIIPDDGDEDDIPLGVLLKRRREQRASRQSSDGLKCD